MRLKRRIYEDKFVDRFTGSNEPVYKKRVVYGQHKTYIGENRPISIYLDDERQPPKPYILVKTPKEAIDLLKRNKNIKILSLDHDLGDDIKIGTGYDVLLWIEKEVFTNPKYVPPTKILIHTANPSARKKMELAVRRIEDAYSRLVGEAKNMPNDFTKAIRKVMNLHDKIKDEPWRELAQGEIKRRDMIKGLNDLRRLYEDVVALYEKFGEGLVVRNRRRIVNQINTAKDIMKYAQKSIKNNEGEAFAYEADVILMHLHNALDWFKA